MSSTSVSTSCCNFSTIAEALGGQVELPGAAVVGIGAALDQAGFLEPVDHPAQRDRLDLEPLGIEALVLARGAVEQSAAAAPAGR